MTSLRKSGKMLNTLLYREYKFKFYLNANHYITINGKKGDAHPHTWEYTLDIMTDNSEFVSFNNFETAVEKYFNKYQNQLINAISPFDKVEPTLENMAEHFMVELRDVIEESGGRLIRLEASETPTRSYILSFERDDNFITEIRKKSDDKITDLVDSVADKIMKKGL